MAKHPSYLPSEAWTVGGLIDARTHVTWHCEHCRAWGPVNLLRVAQRRGIDFCLVDKVSRCRQTGCGGAVHFRYAPDPDTPSRPLKALREREAAMRRVEEDRQMTSAKAAYNAVARSLKRPLLP